MSDKPIKVAICMPIARGAHPSTMRCLMKLIGSSPFDHFFDDVGMQVDVARNRITESACAFDDVTHLLWIDDDMTFTREDAMKLLAHDLPIVGGLCFGRRMPYPPTMIHMTQRGFSFDYEYPRDQLAEVDATGAAFLLVKKEVYYKIHEKYKEGPWSPIGVGEDVSFCRRARDVGYKVFVDTSVKIGHIAEIEIDADMANRLRDFLVNPWYPPQFSPPGPPVASVIIPTWNQKPERLRAAVESALHQTVPVEVIVVDNGSDVPVEMRDLQIGDTPNIGDERIRLFRIPKNGGSPWAALNLGITKMTTPWFTWLSSDDLLYAPKIERQLAEMKRVNTLTSFHGYDIMFGDWGIAQTVVVPVQWTTIDEQRRLLAQGCCINGLTVMIHRSVLDAVGVFDTNFLIAADWDLWNRIGERFLWHPINLTLATRREYDNATQRYAKDPAMRSKWAAEDAEIRRRYSAAGGLPDPVSGSGTLGSEGGTRGSRGVSE